MQIKFSKLHGLGNDYVFVDTFNPGMKKVNLNRLARRVSYRHLGIGSDGLIVITQGQKYLFRMRVFNVDGTEGEMCGNGVRCAARYIYENGLSKNKKQKIETKAGIIETEIVDPKTFWVKADLGKIKYKVRKLDLKLKNKNWKIDHVTLGEHPHAIVFVREFPENWTEIGSLIETHRVFPKRTNVEFVKILNPGKFEQKTWERGCGVTIACGTGTTAALITGYLDKKLKPRIEAVFKHGALEVKWDLKNNHLFLIGPAEKSFEGILYYE